MDLGVVELGLVGITTSSNMMPKHKHKYRVKPTINYYLQGYLSYNALYPSHHFAASRNTSLLLNRRHSLDILLPNLQKSFSILFILKFDLQFRIPKTIQFPRPRRRALLAKN